jgi:hypothetical protein
MDKDFLKGLALSLIITTLWVLVYGLAAWLLWQVNPYYLLLSLSYQDLFFTSLCCFFCMGLVSNGEARRFWLRWFLLLPILLVFPGLVSLFQGSTSFLIFLIFAPYYLALKTPLACIVLFVAVFLTRRFWPEDVNKKTAPPDIVRRG